MKLIRAFILSAAALLLALATAKLLAGFAGAGIGPSHEPVLMMKMSSLLLILAACELTVALVCLFGRHTSIQASLIFWLAMNMAVYGWALADASAVGSIAGYLGNASDMFGIEPRWAESLLHVSLGYLLAGGVLSLAWCWTRRRAARPAGTEAGFLKTACRHCGGRVAFPAAGVGRQIPCPHCAATLTLQPAGAAATTAESKSCPV
jgi:ribosomal protein S27E